MGSSLCIHNWCCHLTIQQLWIVQRLGISRDDGDPLFSVSYMQWDEFKRKVLRCNPDDLGELSGFDCILGGIDYTIDYR